jgi:hypothetical protein
MFFGQKVKPPKETKAKERKIVFRKERFCVLMFVVLEIRLVLRLKIKMV